MIRAGVLVAFLVMAGLFLYLKAFRNASLDGVVNAPKYVSALRLKVSFALQT